MNPLKAKEESSPRKTLLKLLLYLVAKNGYDNIQQLIRNEKGQILAYGTITKAEIDELSEKLEDIACVELLINLRRPR